MVKQGANSGVLTDGPVRGRGAGLNPANRFEKLSLEVLDEHLQLLAEQTESWGDGRQVATRVYRDRSRTILNRVDSPDLGLSWTVNPYRGCEHGCVYCYARPTHEMLGFSSGLDFETRILAKTDAADLLRRELAAPRWRVEPIAFSGVTDCYQPVEARMKITRACMEVLAEARQPVSIVTKSRLILRDLDLLQDLAGFGAVHAAVSLTTLDNKLAARMEPRAASPADRLWTIRRLASAGIPVVVMVAPVIPGLTDTEVPGILEAAADAGARSAGFVLLRLPHQNRELFQEWLKRICPERADRVLALVRSTRGGQLNESAWHRRLRGSGPYAEQIRQSFKVFAARHGLDRGLPAHNSADFRPPAVDGQLSLFGDGPART